MTDAKKERRRIAKPFVWACVVVLLASLPYIVGLVDHPKDGVFVGFTYNIDDACVYASWVRQIADGSFLIRNQYTSEPQHALQFNVFFLVLGLISRVTHLSPPLVLHLARIVLGIGLLLLVWRFSGRFFRDPIERSLIVPIVGLSAGLGWLVPGIEGHRGPVDLWQPEAITFLSIYLNPLFLVGMILMVASLHFLYRMKDSRAWGDALLAGLMLLILGNVHTYDVATVGAVWAVYLVAKIVRTRRVPWRVIGMSAVAAAVALPSLAYQLYLYHHEEVFRLRVESPTPSPAFWAYLMGYGLVLALAIAGAWLALRQKRGALVLVVWSLIGFALPYAPIAQQRKLVMGLHIPLAILATIAAAELVRRVGQRNARAVAMLLIALLVPSNLSFLAQDIGRLRRNDTAPEFRPYVFPVELRAMRWLREHTKPEDTVLTVPELALYVPVFAGNRVYYGHWSETPGYGEKIREWWAFINPATPEDWRLAYLRHTGARYLIYFSHPAQIRISIGGRKPSPVYDLRSARYASVVFDTGKVAVYRLSLPTE